MIRTADDRLYTGVTTDVDRRFEEHSEGGARAARFLRGRGPLELVYRCRVGDRSLALRVEYGLKRCTRDDKEHVARRRMRKRTLLRTLGLDDAG